MRIFSKKELAYLEKLKERNAQLIRGKDLTEASERELFYQPLSNPMAANERKIRQRIREKAVMAIADLVLAGCAGVVPDKKLRKEGVRDISGIFDQLRTAMLLEMVCGEDVATSLSRKEVEKDSHTRSLPSNSPEASDGSWAPCCQNCVDKATRGID